MPEPPRVPFRARLSGPWTPAASRVLAALAAVVGLAVVPLFFLPPIPVEDEVYHHREIEWILERGPRNHLPMLPGYHLILAGIGKVFGIESIGALRVVSAGFGLAAVAVFLLCARWIDRGTALPRTFAFLLLPSFFPLISLVYTDALALLFLLLALHAVQRRRPEWAGLLLTAAFCVRQAHLAWLLLFLPMAWSSRPPGAGPGSRAVRSRLLSVLPFLLPAAAGAAFLLWNRGLVVAGSPAARLQILTGDSGLHTGNLYLSLALVPLLLLPLVVAQLPRIGRTLRRPWAWAAVGLVLAGQLLTFEASHPWNEDPWYLGNRLLVVFEGSIWGQGLHLLLVALAAAFLASVRLRERPMYALYPVWALGLLPVWLVTPRYELPMLVFLLLFLDLPRPRLWWVVAGYLAVLTAVFEVGFLRGSWGI